MLGKLGEIVTGIICELLTLPDPNDKYFEPEIIGTRRDECGEWVTTVRADNYRDIERVIDGTSSHEHIGYHLWEVR